MDVAEVRQRKAKLEQEIRNSLQEFCNETGMQVEYIAIDYEKGYNKGYVITDLALEVRMP